MATIPDELALALQHHQAGRLQAAEQIYRQILAGEPNQAKTLHPLGGVAYPGGKDEISFEYIRKAIGLKGDVAGFYNNLGEAYRALGKPADAVYSFRQALELKPDFADAFYNLGNVHSGQGKLDDAINCYRQAIQLKANYAE